MPFIPNKTGDFYKSENEKLVEYHYLLPEYELSEDFKAGLRELDEKQRKKLDLLEKLESEDFDDNE
jgi:hypothetical protein